MAEEKSPLRSTKKWANRILIAWTVNIVIHATLPMVSEYESLNTLDISRLLTTAALCLTIYYVMKGSIDIYDSLFTRHVKNHKTLINTRIDRQEEFIEEKISKQERLINDKISSQEKLIEKKMTEQADLIEKTYQGALFRELDGISAIGDINFAIQHAERVWNTHFIHHSTSDGVRYRGKYTKVYNVFRTTIDNLLGDPNSGIDIKEISSKDFEEDTRIKNESYPEKYSGKYIDISDEGWMNFTIVEPKLKSKNTALWFGNGVAMNGDLLSCFYTENENMIKDFKKRFDDLFELAEIPKDKKTAERKKESGDTKTSDGSKG